MRSKNLTGENRQIAEKESNNPKLLIFLVIKTTLSILIFCLLSANIFGQTKEYTGNTHDQTLRGSGTVNSSTLGMEMSVPLGGYPGRGINLPINLSYSSKVWRMSYSSTIPSQGAISCFSVVSLHYAEKSASGWTTSLAVPYIEYTGQQNAYLQDGTIYNNDINIACDPGGSYPEPAIYNIRRITLYLPSGESHELRLDDTPAGTGGSWEGTYYAADGSNIKYIQDSTNSIYRVLMPDGSFYDIDHSTNKATKFTDRNGNYTTYHAPDSTYPNGYWTDTLGRIFRFR